MNSVQKGSSQGSGLHSLTLFHPMFRILRVRLFSPPDPELRNMASAEIIVYYSYCNLRKSNGQTTDIGPTKSSKTLRKDESDAAKRTEICVFSRCTDAMC